MVNNGAYTSDEKVEMLIDVLEAGGISDVPDTEKYVECRQLAVNIKDFIDSDSTVTAYPDPSGDTYYGVDRTPYINEVESEVDAGQSGGNGKFIELFNPYDENIVITGWKISGTTMPEITLIGTVNAQDWFVIADDATAYVTDFDYESGAAADQYDPNVNSLTTNGEVLTLTNSGGFPVQVTHYGDAASTSDSMQLNDPRPTPLMNSDGIVNIDASTPWRWEKQGITAGSVNGNFDPAKGADLWSSGTWTPSFVIPDRYFSNKGYLGFIHNGRQWTSFKVDNFINYPNVLQYITVIDPSMDGIDNDGDGEVDSADTGAQVGDIDGKEYRIPGMINVNTAEVEVLESLPDGSGGTLGNLIAIAIQGSVSKPFENIGDLVKDVTEITNAGGLTKWEKEERFRSISNLITTRSNVFTVYVTAQVTDDAGTDVFAEKRLMAIVDRSVDPIRVRYFRWITE